MAQPSTRQGLIDYCLRKLGHPVTEINVDDDQLSDRIDDALQYYQDYHYDGVERIYLKQKMTASVINLTTAVNTSTVVLSVGEKITGLSSNATATVTHEFEIYSAGTSILVQGTSGTFLPGETVVSERSGLSSVVSTFTLGVVDLQYVPITDAVVGVVRILPFSNVSSGQSYMWDIRYQLRLNDMFDLLSTSLIYYQQVKQQLGLIDQLLVGSKSFHFQRHMNRLYIDMMWGTDIQTGEYIMLECYRILDPDSWTDVYNDRFLKRYATALIKRQWGENLKKFEGIQMPGGVTLNGQKIWDEAMTEIDNLENEAQSTYVEPPMFQVG